MKNKLLYVLMAVVLLASCYGKKIKINDKSEVYYKGDATEAEAKKLGDFLLTKEYFDSSNAKSVQLVKDSSHYIVKFVVDKEAIKKDTVNVKLGYKVWGKWISDNVFDGKAVDVVLADTDMSELMKIERINMQDSITLIGIGTSNKGVDSVK